MPHYEDGTPATVGDHVVGKTYNLGGKVISGTLISITPGADSCNCIVAYAEIIDPLNLPYGSTPAVVTRNAQNELVTVLIKTDYGEVKALRKVGTEQQ